jgi:hypothetical protein
MNAGITKLVSASCLAGLGTLIVILKQGNVKVGERIPQAGLFL